MIKTRSACLPAASVPIWLAESGKGELRDLERAALRLHRCGEYALNSRRLAREGERYRLAAARACLERRVELPKDYEENPLDDQEKLDEIRRAVFGSAPNSKPQRQQK